MRIVIDMQGAQSPGSRARGIGRYTRALARSIIANRCDHEVLLALNGSFSDSIKEIKAEFGALLPPNHIRTWRPIGPISFHDRANEQRRYVAEAHYELFLASLAPDAVLVSSPFEGFSDDSAISIGKLPTEYATTAVLYDLIPFIRRDPYLADANVNRWYLNRIDHVQSADALLAISESSRQEAVKHLRYPDERAIYIGTDADPQFKPSTSSLKHWGAVQTQYGISRPFVMYTGGIDHRKNIDGLIRAFAKLPKRQRDEHQLAIVCSVNGNEKERLLSLAADAGLPKDALVLTGFVPEDDLILFYSRCKLFVFPSLHEGFGLPALEAMRCGAPVIASNCSSLPEVVGNPGALFDPMDEDSITTAIDRALKNEGHLEKLRENAENQSKKFCWDDVGRRAISALQSAAEWKTAPNEPARARPSMAYLSPLPPARSGIADFSAELLPELSRHYAIDLILKQDSESISDPYIAGAFRCVDENTFRKTWQRYDRILYNIGNSDHHSHMFDLLNLTSGVAILHDFYVSSIMEYCQATIPPHTALTNALYRSHGYPALVLLAKTEALSDIVWRYPCSRQIFEDASGVVLHSDHGARLAKDWYGSSISQQINIVPLARAPAAAMEKQEARSVLGVAEDTFLVCSFGMIGPTKLTDRLVEAWHRSGLGDDANCRLVLVGKNADGDYGEALTDQISQSGVANVEITGWADPESYQAYLAAADVGVQLRARSRGETSAAALDCLNFGLPLIANANGSMADLPSSAVTILPDHFEVEELALAIKALRADGRKRARMAKNGQAIIKQSHSPAHCAELYRQAIESLHARRKITLAFERLLARLEVDPVTMLTVAERVTQDVALPQRRLFLDISLLVQFDAHTGIQRVVRSLLRELVSQEGPFRVEPCYLGEGGRYRYARNFMGSFLDVQLSDATDDVVDFAAFDTLLCLDLNPVGITSVAGYLKELHDADVRIAFVVYDLLPIKHPECFEPGAEEHHRRWLDLVLSFDQALCISRSVADDLEAFASRTDSPATAAICHFPLGSDFERYPDNRMGGTASIHGTSSARPNFLMVGTVEPRKGYALILDAFEELWNAGADIGLCIVGKKGWLVDELTDRITRLAADQERLVWLSNASDEVLAELYRSSTALIAASVDEGFGLPLVEAAYHDLPIIARDIPVFREVGGPNAAYFHANDGLDLASFIEQWLSDWRKGRAPCSSGIKSLSWKNSSDALLAKLCLQRDPSQSAPEKS